MSLLKNVKTPADLKKLSVKELPILASEIREKIIEVADSNGGHLASSLGAVDAILAMFYVFDFPCDKVIFDVGHQAYAYKILSERKEAFDTIRTYGGLSGFPNIFESEYDSFTSGHAGDSISAALGYATARDKLGEDYFVIAFVGDGSFVNGENLEALFSSDKKPQKLLVILNDNGMSISKNSNGLYKVLTKMSMKKRYSKFMAFMDKIFGWNFIGRMLKSIKASFKRSLDAYGMMDTLGIKYVGPFDGHDIKLLVKLFKYYKESPRATLLHIKTKKGKGFEPAENSAEFYHGVSSALTAPTNSFSDAIGKIICDEIEKDGKTVAVTAGMLYGTGLFDVKDKYPENVFDVGISEEFAVTYASGLALAGLKPIVCIYSTFLQRAYDQVITNVCLQKLPVVFLIDRAGVVGADGATHQGVFDLSYLTHIPHMTVLCPKDTIELKSMISYAFSLKSPVAIRYPNGNADEFETHTEISAERLWEVEKEGDGKVLLCSGPRMLAIGLESAKNTNALVVNARTVKPLDEKMLLSVVGRDIITLEDNVLSGGFGEKVAAFFMNNGVNTKVVSFGFGDEFVTHGTTANQLQDAGITVENVKMTIES